MYFKYKIRIKTLDSDSGLLVLNDPGMLNNNPSEDQQYETLNCAFSSYLIIILFYT